MSKTNYSLNIAGFSIAFAAFYILMTQVYYALTFDKFYENHQRIYTVCSKWTDVKWHMFISRHVGEKIKRECSEDIESSFFYMANPIMNLQITNGEETKNVEATNVIVSPDFVQALQLDILEGKQAEIQYNEAVITENFAKTNGLKIGDYISPNSKYSLNGDKYKITAIIKSFPDNSSFANTDILTKTAQKYDDPDDELNWNYTYCYKLKENINIDSFKQKATKQLENQFQQIKIKKWEDAYISSEIQNTVQNGSYSITASYIAIAIFIILITLINYRNFFYASYSVTLKKVNTKKILGCPRGKLILEIISSTLQISLISLVIAWIITIICDKAGFRLFINGTLEISENIFAAVITIVIAIISTIFFSLGPAIYITQQNPAMGVKGVFFASKGKRISRYFLMGLQYIILFILTISEILILQNYNYLTKKELGFNKENLLSMDLNKGIIDNYESLRQDLIKTEGIVDVAFTEGEITKDKRMVWGRIINDNSCKFDITFVSWNFPEFIGLYIKEGRFFNENDTLEDGAAIFTEFSKQNMNLKIGDEFTGMNSIMKVVGICNDFHFKSLKNSDKNFAFCCTNRKENRAFSNAYIRIEENANISQLEQKIKEICIKHDQKTNYDYNKIETFFIQNAKNYSEELELTVFLLVFDIVSYIITTLGLIGLILNETEQRKKEISIRRVNGATMYEIYILFIKKIIGTITICFLITIPIIETILKQYLSTFANHTEIKWWIFAAAYANIAIWSLLIIVASAWKNASKNPAEVLKQTH